ncbi:MAG TPA: MBL fold metallo-hydrolase [Candidatus Obscuribacterales bacterium]
MSSEVASELVALTQDVATAIDLKPLEKLTVDVLMDNQSDNYSSKPPHVIPEFNNVFRAGARELSGATLCCAQLGLSLMLTGHIGSQRHKLLFDAGPEGSLLVRNCKNLGVVLSDVEAIAVSHGHWDHMGALTEMLDEITRGGKRVPCHVNDDMFVERGVRLIDGRVMPFQSVPSPAVLEKHGADVVSNRQERLLLDGFFYLSGEIPRVTSFEKGRIDHLCRENQESEWRPDPFLMDERYLAANLKDRGLIIFSACSHAGIINVLHHARDTFGSTPIYAIFGGLHLVGALEKIIPDTVQAMKEFSPKQVVPAHCSGWRAVHALINEFGENIVVPSAVGSRYVF